MITNNLQFDFTVNKATNSVEVTREFAAGLPLVWAAWTTPELLDQWWAPRPFKNETKSMDFTVGGTWLYSMLSPEGARHWCRADYKSIDALKSYSGLDAFCDEEGNINVDFPRSLWNVSLTDKNDITSVFITVSYDKLEDLEQIISLGFKEGFTMAMGNLDELLANQ